MKKIQENSQVSPISLFFIPQSMQFGVSFLSFQRTVSESTGQDAWIVMILAGLLTLGALWMIFRLLENERQYGSPDLFSINRRLFGRWIGTSLNLAVVFYITLFGIIFLRSYIEILQVWIFSRLPIWAFATIFCFLIWYIVLGGIRMIAGISLISFVLMTPYHQGNFFAVKDADFSNLLPIFDHSAVSFFQSFIPAVQNLIGFEAILFFYPFVKRPEKARKWGYFSLLLSTYQFVTVMILGIAYFSQGYMQRTIWPTLTFWSSVFFPLLEHVDIIAVAMWLWVLLPRTCLGAWAASRGIKQMFPVIRQKYALIFVLLSYIIACELLPDGEDVEWINLTSTWIGVGFVYGYIPLLLLYQSIINKVRGNNS